MNEGIERPTANDDRPRILAVDDDHAVRVSIKAMFRPWDYDLVLAEGGQQAIDLLEQEAFTVILSDIMMPGVDGIRVLETAGHLHPQTPVVMLTGAQDFTTAIRALRGGAIDYVQKPVTQEDLKEAIERALTYRKRKERSDLLAAEIEAFIPLIDRISTEDLQIEIPEMRSDEMRRFARVFERMVNGLRIAESILKEKLE